jgi:hypothetical protein
LGQIKDAAVNSDNEPAPEATQSLAGQQASYLQATQKVTNQLMELANQSMSIPPQLIQSMGDAINRMQSSMMMMEQDKTYMSTTHATNAVESLNQATIEMLRTAQNCASGSGGGKNQSTSMQMLQQIQKMGPLGQIMGMLPGMGGMAKEAQAAVDRIGDEWDRLSDHNPVVARFR